MLLLRRLLRHPVSDPAATIAELRYLADSSAAPAPKVVLYRNLDLMRDLLDRLDREVAQLSADSAVQPTKQFVAHNDSAGPPMELIPVQHNADEANTSAEFRVRWKSGGVDRISYAKTEDVAVERARKLQVFVGVTDIRITRVVTIQDRTFTTVPF